MMNLNNLTTRNSKAIEGMNAMTNEAIQEVIETRMNDTFNKIVDLKANKKQIINLVDNNNIVRTLARLGYVAGSMVGIITNLVEVSAVLMDNKYNKQFLKKDTNKVDMFKLSKVFTCLNSKPGCQEGYNEIFIEVGKNVFVTKYVDGRNITLVKATKADIQKFVDQLSTVRSLTQEDLVKIGRDLEKIGRVMQELEIDSAKDASVKEGMLEITEFMNGYNCTLASKKATITHNFEQIVNNKKNKGNNNIDFEYKIEDYIALDDIYDIAKEEYQGFLANNPNATEADKVKAKNKICKDLLKESYIEDAAMEFKMRMVHQQAHDLSQLVERYKASNMSLFNEFQAVSIPGADVKNIEELKNFTVLCCEMIHNHYKYKKHFAVTKIEDLMATLRNAIYSLGEALGFTPEQTFRIGCHAGWFKMTSYKGVDKVVVSNNYRFTAISGLFETELKWHFNADAMYSTLEVELPDEYAIAPNTAIQMEDGVCEVVLENGDTDFIICTEENYTGIVIAKVINNEPVFVKYENQYAYESIEFVMYDKVCDIYAQENKFNAADSKDRIALATKSIEEASTCNLSESDKNLLETADANKFEVLFPKWANYIELSVADKDNFGLFINNVQGQHYISIRNHANGASKMLGRMACGVKSKKMGDYNAMDTIVCAAGAITILK